MATIDVESVRRIIETDVSDDDIENAFIPTTAAFMTAKFADCDALTDDLDTQIRLWLCAFFISAAKDAEAGSLIEVRTDQIYTRVAGGVGTRDMFGGGLKMNRFGQMALLLDPCQSLQGLDLPEARITVDEPPYPYPVQPAVWW